MCQFFSGIAFRNGDIKFTEDDSHTTLIERVGLETYWRKMSGQLAVMMPSRILPPIRPFNSFGMLAGSKT